MKFQWGGGTQFLTQTWRGGDLGGNYVPQIQTSTARKQMLDFFIRTYGNEKNSVVIDHLLLAQVSPTKSENLM